MSSDGFDAELRTSDGRPYGWANYAPDDGSSYPKRRTTKMYVVPLTGGMPPETILAWYRGKMRRLRLVVKGLLPCQK